MTTHKSGSIVKLDDRSVGPGSPCFIIAEVGVNHNGDAETAHKMVDVVADSGADCVKFQTFKAERVATAWPLPSRMPKRRV